MCAVSSCISTVRYTVYFETIVLHRQLLDMSAQFIWYFGLVTYIVLEITYTIYLFVNSNRMFLSLTLTPLCYHRADRFTTVSLFYQSVSN